MADGLGGGTHGLRDMPERAPSCQLAACRSPPVPRDAARSLKARCPSPRPCVNEGGIQSRQLLSFYAGRRRLPAGAASSASGHRECPERRDQHRRGRAVLGDSGSRLSLRVQLIGEALDRGVEQLRRQHRGAGEQHQRPPQRPGRRIHERRQRRRRARTSWTCRLRSVRHAVREPLQREPEARAESLVLVDAHQVARRPPGADGSLPVPIRCSHRVAAPLALRARARRGRGAPAPRRRRPFGIDSRLTLRQQRHLGALQPGRADRACCWWARWAARSGRAGEERFGRTLWQSIDATVIGGVSSEVLKQVFSRERPDSDLRPQPLVPGRRQPEFSQRRGHASRAPW